MPQVRNRPYDILVVDDEIGDVELIKSALAEGPFPCRVAVANDGLEAMAFLRRETPDFREAPTPDLILLDLNMPRMNGQEVLRAVKSDPHLACLPVVVLTTSDADHDARTAYTLGAAGYVTKPLDIEQLFSTIHSIEAYWFNTVRGPAALTVGFR